MASFQDIVAVLRSLGEPTRLRLLTLCSIEELTVSELVEILAQSQPRVSRHLKLLADSGLIDRRREGNWTFHRTTRDGEAGSLVAAALARVPSEDAVRATDRDRLEAVRRRRHADAMRYFEVKATEWDAIRSLHVDEEAVEQAIVDRIPDARSGSAGEARRSLDIGTGTARIMEIVAPHVSEAIGVDLSQEMLALARARLARPELGHCRLRKGDMYGLPAERETFDLITIHQVLHYASAPERVLSEAARVLRPEGRLIVVDFERHDLDFLRDRDAHRHLGFNDDQVRDWLESEGLRSRTTARLDGDPLTVLVWSADKPSHASPVAPIGAARRERELNPLMES